MHRCQDIIPDILFQPYSVNSTKNKTLECSPLRECLSIHSCFTLVSITPLFTFFACSISKIIFLLQFSILTLNSVVLCYLNFDSNQPFVSLISIMKARLFGTFICRWCHYTVQPVFTSNKLKLLPV